MDFMWNPEQSWPSGSNKFLMLWLQALSLKNVSPLAYAEAWNSTTNHSFGLTEAPYKKVMWEGPMTHENRSVS